MHPWRLKHRPFRVDASNSGRRKRGKFPVSYTDVQPTVSGKPEPSASSDIDPDSFFLDGSASAHPNEWLLQLTTEPEDVKDRMSFSAYFSRTPDAVFKTSRHLLLLITKPVAAPATVHHAANMVKAITENVNPGQPVVIQQISLFMPSGSSFSGYFQVSSGTLCGW